MNYVLVIVAGLAIAGSGIIVAGRKGVWWGFLLWICSLGLGYRTLPVTDGFKLHPSAIVIVAVFLWLLLTASSRVHTVWWTPTWIWAMVPFWWWGWTLGKDADFAWDEMLSELQNFLVLIPIFIVVATVLKGPKEWKIVVQLYYATATFIAILGLVEYFYPSVRYMLPGFVSNTNPYIGEDGFARAPFSFWGHQAATFLCAMTIPFAIPIVRWQAGRLARIITWASLVLLISAVYLSGYRVLWLLVALQFVLWLILNRHYALGIVAAAAAIDSYAAVPDATRLRFESFILALQGTPVETSGADHLNRLADALSSIQEEPFGIGWTGSGWVHSDFIQVAANLGVIPGLIFASAYLWTALKLFKLVGRGNLEERPLYLALLLAYITAGGIVSTQVIIVLPQLACPVWLIWALAAVALRQHAARKENTIYESSGYASQSVRIAPGIQLPEYNPENVGVG